MNPAQGLTRCAQCKIPTKPPLLRYHRPTKLYRYYSLNARACCPLKVPVKDKGVFSCNHALYSSHTTATTSAETCLPSLQLWVAVVVVVGAAAGVAVHWTGCSVVQPADCY